MIGIVVAVVAIIAVVVVLFVAMPGALGSSATLNITVNSTHILNSVSYNLYVDGSLIDSDDLPAGYYMSYTYNYHWASADDTTIVVSATATGGGIGSTSDYSTITVTDGGTYTVSLYI